MVIHILKNSLFIVGICEQGAVCAKQRDLMENVGILHIMKNIGILHRWLLGKFGGRESVRNCD